MIRVEDADGVRTVTIDRPDKRNALTSDMLAALGEAFRTVDRARACVLLGTGPVFCAGFDLRERAGEADLPGLRAQLRQLSQAIAVMRASGRPVVVGVQGAAIAGGCALLGGADVVVADRGAKLGYPVTLLGISPAVTAPFLRERVGDGAARALLLNPELITATQAQDIGLVDHLVNEPGAVSSEAMAIAREMAAKPTSAMRATGAWVARVCGAVESEAGLAESLNAIDAETFERLEKGVWSR